MGNSPVSKRHRVRSGAETGVIAGMRKAEVDGHKQGGRGAECDESCMSTAQVKISRDKIWRVNRARLASTDNGDINSGGFESSRAVPCCRGSAPGTTPAKPREAATFDMGLFWLVRKGGEGVWVGEQTLYTREVGRNGCMQAPPFLPAVQKPPNPAANMGICCLVSTTSVTSKIGTRK